jgi:hypothetical protein
MVSSIVIVNESQRIMFPEAILLQSSINHESIQIKTDNKINILNVGTICPRKNQLELIKFLSSNEKIFDEAYFVGLEKTHPHNYYIDYGNECKQYDNNKIHIIESCNSIEYYNKCNVFVFVSLNEECPLVMLEALYHELYVISYNVGITNEIIYHGINGFIINTIDELPHYLSIINTLKPDKSLIKNWMTDSIYRIDKWKSIIFNPITLLIDMDNTIADYSSLFLSRMKFDGPFDKYFGHYYDDESLKKNFYTELLPYDGAIDAVIQLNKLPNCIVYFLSHSESDITDADKKIWINKYFGSSWVDRLITVRESSEKINIQGDILIDDNPNLGTSKYWRQIFYYQSYNKHKSGLIDNFTWSPKHVNLLVNLISTM